MRSHSKPTTSEMRSHITHNTQKAIALITQNTRNAIAPITQHRKCDSYGALRDRTHNPKHWKIKFQSGIFTQSSVINSLASVTHGGKPGAITGRFFASLSATSKFNSSKNFNTSSVFSMP